MRRVLIIDDELARPAAAEIFRESYPVQRFVFDFATSLSDTRRKLDGSHVAILLDIRFEGQGELHGLDILPEISKLVPGVPIIMLSMHTDPSVLIRAWDLGASSYIVKWADNPRFYEELQEKLERFALYRPKELLIGSSPKMRHLKETIKSLAGYDINILIEGETGTGKESVAESLYTQSKRSSGPLMGVNCGAIPESLAESELFGHRKGAFTGAYTDAKGKVEEADGGVLFLDEIGELKPDLQVKLLRFLDRKEFFRVGESTPRTSDVQIVCATNRRLEDEVRAGRFREDLYYRLNGFRIETPPLRECRSDIPLLANHFLELHKNKRLKPISGFSTEVLDLFAQYRWPGNVRELENVVERAFIVTEGGEITVSALPDGLRKGLAKDLELLPRDLPDHLDLDRYTAQVQWEILRRVYNEELPRGKKGIKRRVAERLGLHPVNGVGRRVTAIRAACPELAEEIDALFT